MNEHGGVRVSADRHVVRAATGRLVAATVWVASAVLFVWLAAVGRWEVLADAAPWVLLIGWFAYISQWRPNVVIGRQQLRVVNGLRTHVVPYGAIKEIQARYSVVLRLKDRSIHCWGAPLPDSAFGAGLRMQRVQAQRPYTILPSNEQIGLDPIKGEGRSLIVAAWEEATQRYKETAQEPTTTWFLPAMVIGGVLLIWAVISAVS